MLSGEKRPVEWARGKKINTIKCEIFKMYPENNI